MALYGSRYFKVILFVFLVFIIVNNIIILFIKNKNEMLSVDEFQHAHIAWHIRNGKVLYKDFFDHHGAFVSLLNGCLFHILQLPPQMSTLSFFKYCNIFYSLFILLITYSITRKLTKSHLVSLFAVVLLTSNLLYLNIVVQNRPDILQNLFFLLGIFFLMDHMERNKKIYGITAGIFFSLSLEANPKTLLLFFLLFLFYLFILIMYRRKMTDLLKEISWIFYGFIAIKIPFLLYFSLNGALYEYFYYTYPFNFILNQFLSPELTKSFLGFYALNMFGFSFIVLAGYYFLFSLFSDKTKSLKDTINYYLIFFLSLSFLFILLMDLYQQSPLMALPFLSIIGACGFMYIFRRLMKRTKISSMIFLAGNVLFIFLTLVLNSWTHLNVQEDKIRTYQKEGVQYILDHTEREAPVPYLGGRCGAYLFNEDLHYYWFPYLCNDTRELINLIEGKDIYGDVLVQLLKEKKVPYLLYEDNEDYRTLSPRAKEYMYETYHSKEGLPTIWKRK